MDLGSSNSVLQGQVAEKGCLPLNRCTVDPQTPGDDYDVSCGIRNDVGAGYSSVLNDGTSIVLKNRAAYPRICDHGMNSH